MKGNKILVKGKQNSKKITGCNEELLLLQRDRINIQSNKLGGEGRREENGTEVGMRENTNCHTQFLQTDLQNKDFEKSKILKSQLVSVL